MKANEITQAEFPAYFICTHCGHELIVNSWVDYCENCRANVTWHEYFTDGQDAEDFSETLVLNHTLI